MVTPQTGIATYIQYIVRYGCLLDTSSYLKGNKKGDRIISRRLCWIIIPRVHNMYTDTIIIINSDLIIRANHLNSIAIQYILAYNYKLYKYYCIRKNLETKILPLNNKIPTNVYQYAATLLCINISSESSFTLWSMKLFCFENFYIAIWYHTRLCYQSTCSSLYQALQALPSHLTPTSCMWTQWVTSHIYTLLPTYIINMKLYWALD